MLISSAPSVLRPTTGSGIFPRPPKPSDRWLEGADLITTPFEIWSVGQASLGYGRAPIPVMALSSVNSMVSGYEAYRALRHKTTSEEVNAALKGQNGGNDLQQEDADKLALAINHRTHLSAAIGIGNAVLTVAAMATGTVTAGVGAVAVKALDVGYAGWATYRTTKDVAEALKNQPQSKP